MRQGSFGWNKGSIINLFLYLGVGGFTFMIDVAVIYFSIHRIHASYPLAIGIGFIAATFANYAITRHFIFANTKQSDMVAILYFFGIAFIWLWFTIGGTVFLIRYAHLSLYASRSITGLIIGIAGYVLNSIFTFRMRE
jgi:putative flippase GtrA